jgi:hypothetical protein
MFYSELDPKRICKGGQARDSPLDSLTQSESIDRQRAVFYNALLKYEFVNLFGMIKAPWIRQHGLFI